MKYNDQSSEQDLIKGCQDGHSLAQKFLYMRFYSKMKNVCMRYANDTDEAEEMLNAGFLKVFNAIGRFEGRGSFEGWVRRIVLNSALEHIRRQVKYRETMTFDTYHEGSVSCDAVEALLVEDLYKVIQKLPTLQRMVFCLNLLEGYTHKEIGELLNIPAGTSKWHLSEAKKQFSKLAETYYSRSYHK